MVSRKEIHIVSYTETNTLLLKAVKEIDRLITNSSLANDYFKILTRKIKLSAYFTNILHRENKTSFRKNVDEKGKPKFKFSDEILIKRNTNQ